MMKTKFTYIVALSLDGKISDKSSKLPDWTSKEDWKWFQNKLSKYDAIIVGRKTYEIAKEYINKRVAFVVTKKYKGTQGTVTFINSLIKVCRMVKGYKNVAVVGGQGIYSEAIRIGMIDDLYITLEPVMLGNGISFLNDVSFERVKFVLQTYKKINKNGSILLHYKIQTKC